MDCPSCRAPHPDEAEYCTLCFAPLRAASPGAAPPAAFAAFPQVETLTEGFLIKGPLVIRPDGLWFFVRSVARTRRGGFGNIGGFQLGGAYVRLARLLLDVLGTAVGLPPPRRPEKLEFKPVRRVAEEFDAAAGEAPLIPACAECFTVEKGDVAALTISPTLGVLTVRTRWTSLEVSRAEPRAKASAFLRRQGYPLPA
ncbi:MAG: zinc ribbon domain-containing protein [Elusimicrobia bacterium]|nr:zinc ribbon domain-containing protein [Elusimicrobiota bacterium]